MRIADRTYSLRHPEGFDPAMAMRAEASALVWVTWLNALVEQAHALFPLLSVPPDAVPYEVVAVALEKADTELHIGISGGPGTYGWLKMFEDDHPQKLYEWLPLWYQLHLDLGRSDTNGFYPVTHWRPLFPQDKRRALAEHAAFRRPG